MKNDSKVTGIPIVGFKGKYEFLDNAYPAIVIMDGDNYPSVECAYNAAKTGNREIRRRLMNISEFSELSDLSAVKEHIEALHLREDWNESYKVVVMTGLIDQKFSFYQNPKMTKKLLETGHVELINETVREDSFWGSYKGIGKNWVGKLLMNTRSRQIGFFNELRENSFKNPSNISRVADHYGVNDHVIKEWVKIFNLH